MRQSENKESPETRKTWRSRPPSMTVASRVSQALSKQNLNATKEQLQLGLRVTLAIGDAIKEAGQISEASLYASLMSKMNLQTFERLIAILEGAGCVKRMPGHVLRWAN